MNDEKNEHNEFDENHSRYTKAEDNFEDLDPSTNNEWTDDDENKKKIKLSTIHRKTSSSIYKLHIPTRITAFSN